MGKGARFLETVRDDADSELLPVGGAGARLADAATGRGAAISLRQHKLISASKTNWKPRRRPCCPLAATEAN